MLCQLPSAYAVERILATLNLTPDTTWMRFRDLTTGPHVGWARCGLCRQLYNLDTSSFDIVDKCTPWVDKVSNLKTVTQFGRTRCRV